MEFDWEVLLGLQQPSSRSELECVMSEGSPVHSSSIGQLALPSKLTSCMEGRASWAVYMHWDLEDQK
jgi:hypothetical protein